MGAGGTRRHALYLGRHAARGYYCLLWGLFFLGSGTSAGVRAPRRRRLAGARLPISVSWDRVRRGVVNVMTNVILKSKIDSRPETRHFET